MWLFKNLIPGLLLISFSASFCGQENQSTEKISLNVIDTFVKDIPAAKNNSHSISRRIEIEKKVGIPSIENGFKGLQVRIWIGFKPGEEQLVILKKVNKDWAAEFYKLVFNYGEEYNSLLSITKTGGERKPLSGWESLSTRLLNLNLLTLPDFESKYGAISTTDGYGVTVEVATDSSYRIYSYPNLDSYVSTNSDARKMEDILLLLEKEFTFKRIRQEIKRS